jgi:hypothetical protein
MRCCFCWWRYLAVCCNNIKLSCMKRPLMKVLWTGGTNSYSFGARQLANNFVINLAKLWSKLIGLKY